MTAPTSPATARAWIPLASRTLTAPHFAYSPMVKAGGFIHVSGLVGLDPFSGGLVVGGMAAVFGLLERERVFHQSCRACDEARWIYSTTSSGFVTDESAMESPGEI